MRMEALLLAFMLVVMASAVMAATPVEANVTSATDMGTYNATVTNPEQNVNAGHVYNITVDVESVTKYWAGIIGTVNETAVLGSGSNKLYSWTLSKGGYVFLVIGNDPTNVNWSGLDGGVSTSDFTTLGVWSADPGSDQDFEATYSSASNQCDSINTELGISPTNAPEYVELNSMDATPVTWTTCAYKDANNVVFGVNVASGTAFDGSSTVDFESVVPAKDDGTATTYYIYKV